MIHANVVARVVFTMALFSISKDYFRFKCSPDVASRAWCRFLRPLLSYPTIRQKSQIFSDAAAVALSRCCYGASRQAAASQAFEEKERATVFMQALLLMPAK